MNCPGCSNQSPQWVTGTLCPGWTPLHEHPGPWTLLSPLSISPVLRAGIAIPQLHSHATLPKLGGRFEFPLAQKKITTCLAYWFKCKNWTPNNVTRDAFGTSNSTGILLQPQLQGSARTQAATGDYFPSAAPQSMHKFSRSLLGWLTHPHTP